MCKSFYSMILNTGRSTLIIFLLGIYKATDPEAYYYTTGTLNGLHETERFEDGKKRFGNETKRFGDGTKRFGNGTLCVFGKERFVRFGLVFNFPRYSDFLAWRIGRLFIFATQNQFLIRSTCSFVIFFDL